MGERVKGKESMIRLAVIQMEPRIGEKDENVAKTLDLIEGAAEQSAAFVVLPELCNTGYVFNTMAEAIELSEEIPNGPTVLGWEKKARERNLFIVGGISERSGQKLFNTSVLISPEGYIGKYRKLHLWYEEKLFFSPGDVGLPVFDTSIGRVGMLICYDLWFPESSRILSMEGADLLCSPTNWVPARERKYDELGRSMGVYLTIANAQSNAVYMACADRIGVERGQAFEGNSLICGPSGWPIVGPASRDKEETLVAEVNVLDARRAKGWNRLNDLIKDRRTDVYDWMLGYDPSKRFPW